jgi:hypothetical protein
MNIAAHQSHPGPHFELRFHSLFQLGRDFAFPCNEVGHVDFDGMSEKARNNYFLVKSTVGRDFATPRVNQIPGMH